ncbi:histidine kinase [Methylosinus sp. R-45379]|uniref:sensor histidine kinase n=1 Tax=unclassified Methylosinus TaxID=2624500 RepID=UPI00047E32CF|nr:MULTISPECIES: histidine kinase dimerization/phosphoacceptor domain -containing protein [unclassified Methylosinus]OAI31685.1 histidine kinase [Methylosinus sp. R-45379]TDX62737.1 two-component sensor histidine kinase [Methylosinus sp. sav-2]
MHELFALAARSRALPIWARFLGASGLSLGAFALQTLLHERLPPGQLLLFIPAVMFSALLFGGEAGGWSMAFGAALAAYFLFPGEGFAVSDPAEALALVLFIAVALAIVFVMQELSGVIDRSDSEATAAQTLATKTERLKKLYLQEMAHRTKNDLQFVCSMLQTEARALEDDNARASLLAASSRVAVVSRVYALLQHDGGRDVWMRPLIDDLCANLRLALIGERPIALRTEVADCALEVDEARAVALIVNELVVNALKYAFPEERAGTVKVRLTREGDDLALTVEDNGVGPASMEAMGLGSGHKLVRSLGQQLGGAAIIEPGADRGLRCELRFPAPPE